jgi:hypothetical protein
MLQSGLNTLYSVDSPLVWMRFFSRSIHSRSTACKLTFQCCQELLELLQKLLSIHERAIRQASFNMPKKVELR